MEAEKSSLGTLVAWAVYPGVLALGFVLQALFLGLGQPLMIASYGAAILCSVVITGVEFAFPARREWLGGRREWGNDFVFMGLVQLARRAFNQVLSFGIRLHVAVVRYARDIRAPMAL